MYKYLYSVLEYRCVGYTFFTYFTVYCTSTMHGYLQVLGTALILYSVQKIDLLLLFLSSHTESTDTVWAYSTQYMYGTCTVLVRLVY